MNLLAYLTGIFGGRSFDGQLSQARRVGEQHGEQFAVAYAQGVEAGIGRVLLESQRRLLAFDDVEDADWEPAETREDLAGLTRPQLISKAKELGIDVQRTDTKKDLVAKLS